MKIGWFLPNNWGVQRPARTCLGVRAESLGYDSAWVNHHVLNVGYVGERLGDRPHYDALTTLTWIAAPRGRQREQPNGAWALRSRSRPRACRQIPLVVRLRGRRSHLADERRASQRRDASVTLPAPLDERVDQAARNLGVSRSELISEAVARGLQPAIEAVRRDQRTKRVTATLRSDSERTATTKRRVQRRERDPSAAAHG